MLQTALQWKNGLLKKTIAGTLLLAMTACQGITTGAPPWFDQSLNQLLSQSLTPFAQPKFPANFMWGVSTAGHQGEGGDTTSQWHVWEEAGRTEHRNVRAVDFYNRYEEDIKLARDMGANAFRMSIEWSRIEPAKGVIDRKEIEFYRKVIQTIKKYGMTPLVTLVHFSYPAWLDKDLDGDKLSGWEDPDSVDAYLEYVSLVVREFSPDVQYWLTFNEPNIWLPIAHLFGKTPPGRTNPLGFIRAGINVLNAHARAYDRIHGINPKAMVSTNIFQFQFNPFGHPSHPPLASLNPENMNNPDMQGSIQEAAHEMADSDWFMTTMQTGKAPYTASQVFTPSHSAQNVNIPTVSLFRKFDYVAFDYYYRFTSINNILNANQTWKMPIYPEGLYPALMDYQRRFGKPIMIAENGIGTYDNQPRQDGWTRSACIVQHVNQVQRAIKDGANVIGYYHWSITDNYEWGDFHSRFGLYRVEALGDPLLKRIPTPAVDTYKSVIANQGVNQALLQQNAQP